MNIFPENIQCLHYLMIFTTFDDVKNKHDIYKDEDCMKKFCKSLKKYAVIIINFEIEKTISLTNKQQR